MHCKNCGIEIKENQKFCPKCGNSINISIDDSEHTPKIKQNKKKIIIGVIIGATVILSVIFILIFNSTTRKVKDHTLKNNVTFPESVASVETQAPEAVYNYYKCCDYSEDLAWINFSDTNKNSYWGCIDKQGKLIFKFSAEGIKETKPFSNGFAYIIYENCVKIINKSGNCTGEYKIDENNAVLSYGDGNIFIREHVADFDSSVYNYSIINSIGETVQTFSLEDLKDYYGFQYFGKGIFGYYTKPWEWNIYFPESGKWIDWKAGGNGVFYFKSNMAVKGIEYGGGYDSNDGYRGNLCLIDTKGRVTKFKIPEDFGWNWGVNELNNGYCVMNEYLSKYLVLFNASDNTFTKMPENYITKLDYENLPESLEISDNKIALPLVGSDDKNYIAIFNSKWEMISEPIYVDNYDNYNYSEGRLIITANGSSKVYNSDGKELFNSSEVGYLPISKYNNGISRVENDSKPTYIDHDGNRLFETVDMSIME